MAVINPKDLNPQGHPPVVRYSWQNLSNGDTGKPLQIDRWADKFLHIFGAESDGDFDSESVTMQGSNDERADPLHADHADAEWTILTDIHSNELIRSSNNGEQILENPWWIRPSVSSTGGSLADIYVNINAKRNC